MSLRRQHRRGHSYPSLATAVKSVVAEPVIGRDRLKMRLRERRKVNERGVSPVEEWEEAVFAVEGGDKKVSSAAREAAAKCLQHGQSERAFRILRTYWTPDNEADIVSSSYEAVEARRLVRSALFPRKQREVSWSDVQGVLSLFDEFDWPIDDQVIFRAMVIGIKAQRYNECIEICEAALASAKRALVEYQEDPFNEQKALALALAPNDDGRIALIRIEAYQRAGNWDKAQLLLEELSQTQEFPPKSLLLPWLQAAAFAAASPKLDPGSIFTVARELILDASRRFQIKRTDRKHVYSLNPFEIKNNEDQELLSRYPQFSVALSGEAAIDTAMTKALANEAALLGLNATIAFTDNSKLLLTLRPQAVSLEDQKRPNIKEKSISSASAIEQWQDAARIKWQELGRFQFRHAIALPGAVAGPYTLRALRSFPVFSIHANPSDRPKLSAHERGHFIKYIKLAAAADWEKTESLYSAWSELEKESISYQTHLKLFESRCRRARTLFVRDKDIEGHQSLHEAAMHVFETKLKHLADEYAFSVAVRALALAPNCASQALELHQSVVRRNIGLLPALASADTVAALLRADEIDAALALSLELAHEVSEARSPKRRHSELKALLPDILSWCRETQLSQSDTMIEIHRDPEMTELLALTQESFDGDFSTPTPLSMALRTLRPFPSPDEALECLLSVLDNHHHDELAPYDQSDIEKILDILQQQGRWADAFDLLLLIRNNPPRSSS